MKRTTTKWIDGPMDGQVTYEEVEDNVCFTWERWNDGYYWCQSDDNINYEMYWEDKKVVNKRIMDNYNSMLETMRLNPELVEEINEHVSRLQED